MCTPAQTPYTQFTPYTLYLPSQSLACAPIPPALPGKTEGNRNQRWKTEINGELFFVHPGVFTVLNRFCPFSSVLPSQSLASAPIPSAPPGTQRLPPLTITAPGRGGSRRCCPGTTDRSRTDTQTDSSPRSGTNCRRESRGTSPMTDPLDL